MNRWAAALGASLLVHAGAAVGTAGWMGRPATFEVTAGEARVALALRSGASPQRSSLDTTAISRKKVTDLPGAIPEAEGAQASVPRSLRNAAPPYPAEAFRRGIEGTTSLFVRVSAQGAASRVAIERSSGWVILDEAAAQAVMKWTFLPARRAGIPVPGSIRIRIRFQIVEAEESW